MSARRRPGSAAQLGRTSTATRPDSPEAQHALERAQSTVSKLPSSKRLHVAPPSVLTSLPDGPTAIAVWPSTHATPERYSPGSAAASIHVAPPSSDRAAPSGALVGAAKSPPTASPCSWPRKASAKMPALGPLGIGVELTVHVRPRSGERNTRASAPPPVANQAEWP